MATELQFGILNDRCLLVEPRFADGASIDDRNHAVHRCAQMIASLALDGVEDIVPAFDSLAVFFASPRHRRGAAEVLDGAVLEEGTAEGLAKATVTIPVIYDGEDLPAMAALLEMTVRDLIELHAAPVYRVAMIGFAPGFPYFLGMDPRLSVPRLATPRSKVPAGSVAIGGPQTGIYPQESAGGWRLIGRTESTLFAAERTPPSLLKPGDRVRFEPVAP